MSLDEQIFDPKLALTDKKLQKWCEENNLQFNQIELSELGKVKPRYSFIFTGNQKDEFNKGKHNHWLFLDGTLIFDSYSLKNGYKLPENFKIITNDPPQLQEFDSTVCGEYCCAFYKFISSSGNQNLKENELGTQFSEAYGFTKNKRKNDEIVKQFFDQSSGDN